MARIARKNQKIFAENASNNGVFGSLQANDPTHSNDPDVIQGRTAYSNGWNDATYSSELLPPLEEFQALQYLFSRQLSYIFQEGISEWNASTTYYKGSIAKAISGTIIRLYISIVDNNTNHLVTDTTRWTCFFDSSLGYADVGLTNLNSTGKNIGNWSTNVTNCITNLPQDITLELSSGTLTLKTGSKVYVPNGSGVFNAVTTTSDLSTTRSGSGECIVWYNNNNNTIQAFPSNLVYSGSTAPSGQTYMFWYDTANNKCKVTSNGGSTWTDDKSFPLAILGLDGTQISEIKQVFNGFGFVGTVFFVLPGVKILVPNGKNADGTQKSTLRTLSSVITRDDMGASRTGGSVAISSGLFINYSSNGYVLKEDGFLYTGSGVQRSDCVVGIYSTDANKNITSFEPYVAFLLVDYNEFNQTNKNIATLDAQNVKLTGNQTVAGNKTFSGTTALSTATATTPSSSTDNSTNVATTAWVQDWANNNSTSSLASWSKGQNGYFKFKNGLIVQWGLAHSNTSTNFPTPFSGTNYGISSLGYTTDSNTAEMALTEKTQTSFKVRISRDWDFSWIAIGY